MTVKELNLDVSKWRCGGTGTNGTNRLGEGVTLMLNNEGFMCCLGQFYLQLGYDEFDIRHKSTPDSVGRTHLFTSELGYDNNLAGVLIRINDDPDTTVETKIRLITEQLTEHGVKLNVIDSEGILNG